MRRRERGRKRGWFLVSCALITFATGSAVPAADPGNGSITLSRGGSGTICHCPCKGGSCDCTMHTETCHRCYDLTVNLRPDTLTAILESGEQPILQGSQAPWFEAGPHPELKVRLEGSMRDTGEKEGFQVRFLPDPAGASRYLPDKEFDAAAYVAWSRRVDRQAGASLSVAAKDDPGTWRILDGDARHLNESLAKSFSLLRADGSQVEVFRSESTLGWEADLYLRSVVAGIDEAALQGEEARSGLLSLVALVDLQMKSGDAKGAVRSLDRLIESSQARWLDGSHEDAPGAVCGFRKIRNLLVPGSRCS